MRISDWSSDVCSSDLVESGAIPLARIDDAVSRIVRVKLRAGLFEHRPSQSRYAGDAQAIVDRALARRAVQQSLVLLKNDNATLPLRSGQRLLAIGRASCRERVCQIV